MLQQSFKIIKTITSNADYYLKQISLFEDVQVSVTLIIGKLPRKVSLT